jgi:thioredoxin reductase (NADPH)
MQHSQEDTGSAGPATAVQITETPDTHGAYPRLGVDQLASLEAAGRRRPTTVGDLLFREGDRTTDFFVVLYGLVASVDGYGTARERQISLHGERRFLGELGLLSGQTAFTSVVVRKSGEVLAVPLDRLRRLVATDPGLGDLILRAYLVRRWLLIGLGA